MDFDNLSPGKYIIFSQIDWPDSQITQSPQSKFSYFMYKQYLVNAYGPKAVDFQEIDNNDQ